MLKTAQGLIDYAKSKLGVPYVYGMKMEVMTRAMYDSLKQLYGSDMVWNSDVNKIGEICCDCSGLISTYTGVLQGSSAMKETAVKCQPISTIKDAPPGALVWQNGHVGIYIGMENGAPMYIAEDGSAYGCRKNKLSNATFTHWLLMSYIDYSVPAEPEKEEEPEMIYNAIDENMPEWARATIQKLVNKKYLVGNSKGELGLNDTMLKIFVVNDRAGLYN